MKRAIVFCFFGQLVFIWGKSHSNFIAPQKWQYHSFFSILLVKLNKFELSHRQQTQKQLICLNDLRKNFNRLSFLTRFVYPRGSKQEKASGLWG
jgi:hypothetical protein